MKIKSVLLAFLVLFSGTGINHLANAQDLVPAQRLSLDLAAEIATAAIESCRKDGYQVSVVVTDRTGNAVVIMQDDYANRFFTELAHGKANAVTMSGTTSGEMRENMSRMVDELNQLSGVKVLTGAVPVRVAGSMIGAVGISGAPGGDKDEACALMGVEAVQDRLDFADE
jgi:uncharacterized protein GlcG (DUF336 family)